MPQSNTMTNRYTLTTPAQTLVLDELLRKIHKQNTVEKLNHQPGTVVAYPDGIRSWAVEHIGWPMLVWRQEQQAGWELLLFREHNTFWLGGASWFPALTAPQALDAMEEAGDWSYMRAPDEWGHIAWQARNEAQQEQPIVYAPTAEALRDVLLEAANERA